MNHLVKSYSSIDSSTIMKYQNVLLPAIQWYEQLDEQLKDPIFREDGLLVGILEKLKLTVAKGERVKDRLIINLLDIVTKHLDHLKKEYAELSPRLNPEDKEPIKKRISELEDFIQEVE